MTNTFNGRNSSLDYTKVKRDFELLDFDSRKNDFSHYLKALDGSRHELEKLDSYECIITDDELLNKAKGTLIRTCGMGNYCPTDNGSFNNFLHELALDLITTKTTTGVIGRHKDSFKHFGTPTATVRLLA